MLKKKKGKQTLQLLCAVCVASIISKKAAENVSALVLDVKVGRASFSQTLEDARHLAKNLVRIPNCNSVCLSFSQNQISFLK